MNINYNSLFFKYLGFMIGVGIAVIVILSIIFNVLIPCINGIIPFDYCFGGNN